MKSLNERVPNQEPYSLYRCLVRTKFHKARQKAAGSALSVKLRSIYPGPTTKATSRSRVWSATSRLASRKGTRADSANSAASRLLKNRFSYHDARYNDLGGTAAGSAGMQPYRGIAWWAHGDDHCICANILSALLPTRIGSVDPHALETTARRTEHYRRTLLPTSR